MVQNLGHLCNEKFRDIRIWATYATKNSEVSYQCREKSLRPEMPRNSHYSAKSYEYEIYHDSIEKTLNSHYSAEWNAYNTSQGRKDGQQKDNLYLAKYLKPSTRQCPCKGGLIELVSTQLHGFLVWYACNGLT